MPDTGAPWNIPYVEAADLVSDWPADSLALANAIDAGLDAAGNAGIGSNVVQTVKDDTFSTTSTSLVAVTGLNAVITPTSASSKILIIANVSLNADGNATAGMSLFRGATEINSGIAAGSRPARSKSFFTRDNFGTGEISIVFLDSPATTSATTYEVHVSAVAGALRVNATSNDVDNVANFRTSSTITAIEVKA